MRKFITDIIFGIALGIGFSVAQGVLAFIVQLLSGGLRH